MEHDARLALFWIIHPALLGLFALMCLYIASVWLKARMPGLPAGASRWRKLGAVIGRTVKFIFSPLLWPFLKSLVLDGMIHRRLLRVSPLRWITHIAVFGSFVMLGFLSTLTGLALEIFPLLLPADHFLNTNVVSVTLQNFDHPLIAFVNELLGLIILIGMLRVIYRRYIQKDPQLRTVTSDTIIITTITLFCVIGFPLESFRLLARPPFAPTAGWAFIGYPLARLLQPLNWDWHFWYNLSFWLHIATVHFLLFYTPFSRFAHVIMSPLIVALNSTQEAHA